MKNLNPKSNTSTKKKLYSWLFFFFVLFSFWGKAEALTNKICEDTVSSPGDCYFNYSHSAETVTAYGYYCGLYPDTSRPVTVGGFAVISAFTIQNLCSYGDQYFTATIGGVPYWWETYYIDGETFLLSDETRFGSTTPNNESTIINPNIRFSADWIISNHDLENVQGLGKIIIVSAKISNLNNTWSYDLVNWILPIGTETSTTTRTYIFNGTEDVKFNYGQDYKIVWTLLGDNFFNGFGSVFSVSKTVYFSVGSTTNSGHVQQAFASSTAVLLEAKNFANGISLQACNPLSTDFGIADCVLSLFEPDYDYTAIKVSKFTEAIKTSFPIGYITDFVSIISTTTVGTLTIINATIPNGVIGTGAHINLSLAGKLDDVLNATSTIYANATASSTETLYEITSYYWELIMYITALFYIIARILGSHIIGGGFNTKKEEKIT